MRTALLVALAATACGASPEMHKRMIDARYNTDFATVWNAVQASVREDFPSGIRNEDATVGYIETKWEGVDQVLDSSDDQSDQRSNKRATGTGARNMFRLSARIEPGGPPWQVIVDGEAALYRPNMAMLQPYRHGAIDEPALVEGRIYSMRKRIYTKLKQYDVAAAQGPGKKTP